MRMWMKECFIVFLRLSDNVQIILKYKVGGVEGRMMLQMLPKDAKSGSALGKIPRDKDLCCSVRLPSHPQKHPVGHGGDIRG